VSHEWLILAIAGVLGLGLASRQGALPPVTRLALAALPVLLAALVFVYREAALLNTYWVWSGCRLAPALGWLQGYPLYSPVDAGPVNGWLYGPVAAVAWLPAALARSPAPALLIAAVINLAFLLLPIFAATRRATREARIDGGLAFAAAAAALLLFYPTWYMAAALSVDAVAAGLGAAACVALLGPEAGPRRIVLAALLAALATWTKQVEAPLALGLAAWLWFHRRSRAALGFAAAHAAALLLIAAPVFTLLSARDVVFNLWTVPAHHPLPGGWSTARVELLELVRYSAPLWIPCAGALFLARRGRTAWAPAGASVFLVAALAVLPTGVLAAIKLGGDRNSLHSVYFLAIATALALAGEWPAGLRRSREWRTAGLLTAAVLATTLSFRQTEAHARLTALPAQCLSQEDWAFARTRPGEIYFPWDPLATLLAEGKMYHFEYGVFDRIAAGRPLTAAQLASGLPTRPALVIYPKADYPRTMLAGFPGYVFDRTTDGWIVFRAPPGAAP